MKTRLTILFGSQVSGKTNPRSDFDVAVLSDKNLSLAEKSELSDQIASQLNCSPDSIDLIDLATASPLLQYSVAQTGKIISGKTEDFLRFKVLAWKRYLDTAKFRIYRQRNLAQ